MKTIKNLLLAAIVITLAACSSTKDLVYYQDVPDLAVIKNAEVSTIALQPQDKLYIVVSCREPEIAAMFNLSYSAHNAMNTGTSSTRGGSSLSGSNQMLGYTIDSNGDIDFPVLGKIHAAGFTRERLAAFIKQKLIASNQIKDPVVTVEYINLAVTVLGEVTSPGRYAIDRDHFTVLDAISMAGDLTITGERKNVAVVRRNGDDNILYRLDLTDAASLYASPAFDIQQGDLIYVTPNRMRQRQSTVNGNNLRSVAFWMSLASFLTSIAVFVKNW